MARQGGEGRGGSANRGRGEGGKEQTEGEGIRRELFLIVSSFVCVRDRAFPPNVARDQFPFPSPPLYSPLARQDSSMIPRFDPGITGGEFSARVIIIARVEL